jgi:hypothetical protein
MIMTSIWGTSSNNIYVCGHTSGNTSNFWHYDGSKWTAIDIYKHITGASDPVVISGTSASDIWLAGGTLNPPESSTKATTTPFIIHIDGNGNWKEYNLPHFSNAWILNIYAASANDVWAMGAGSENCLFHFNGVSWERDSLRIPFNVQNYPDIIYLSMVSYKNELYMSASKYENFSLNQTYYLFKRVSDKWVQIDSTWIDGRSHNERKFDQKLLVTADNRFLSYGVAGVYEWDGVNWNHLSNVEVNCMVNSYGNNILAANYGSNVYLYDETSWLKLPVSNPNNIYRTLWTDGKEAFIAGTNLKGWPMRSFIMHGK